ncbi:MAG: DUF5667 domain-containing protein [Dehalococcoidales bacterium]|nr:DUF5667 domain-containing protein [Dehalococcoidales bacterium]
MKKTDEFAGILDECVGRLLAGESIASCLAHYPEHAAELEPLLRAAEKTVAGLKKVRPREEFRERARYQFQAALREMEAERHRPLAFFPRWAVAVSIVVVLLLACTGTVVASSGSLPDSPLYPVKLAAENVRLALTPSPQGKAELIARFAGERVKELVKLAMKGDGTLIAVTAQRLERQLTAVADLAAGSKATEESGMRLMMAPAATAAPTTVPAPSPTPTVSSGDGAPAHEQWGDIRNAKAGKNQKLKELLAVQVDENLRALEAALESAPESVRPSLIQAIEIARAAYAEALARLED